MPKKRKKRSTLKRSGERRKPHSERNARRKERDEKHSRVHTR